MITQTPEKDYRTRVTVFLQADGRQRYFNFYCIYCGNKVCELSGGQVYMLRDLDDISRQSDKPKQNVRCYGKFCRAWLEFTLN